MADRNHVDVDHVAREAGVPVDAIHFVDDALSYAPHYRTEVLGKAASGSEHCTASDLCFAVLQYAREFFGDEYAEVLREWGIRSSEDLGRIVFTLIRFEVIAASESDKQSDFDGQFNLEQQPPDA